MLPSPRGERREERQESLGPLWTPADSLTPAKFRISRTQTLKNMNTDSLAADKQPPGTESKEGAKLLWRV